MTLTTDTQRPQSATRRERRLPPARIAAYGAGVALAVALGALALNAPSTYGQADEPDSAYARPTQSLQGQSLAAYISGHQADRLARTQ